MKKKLLIYSDCFEYSGSEKVIENLYLSKDINRDFEIKFYYARNRKYIDKIKNTIWNNENSQSLRVLNTDVLVYEFRLCNERISKLFLGFKLVIAFTLRYLGVYSIYNFIILQFVIFKENPNVLLINNGGYPGALSARIATLTSNPSRKKTIMIVNNMAIKQSSYNFFNNALNFLVIRCVNKFVTASNAAGLRLIEVLKINKNKVISIPNTITKFQDIKNVPPLFSEFGDNKVIIGSVGLLTYRKGFHILLKAIEHMKSEIEALNVIFLIFGEGEERPKLEEFIAENSLRSFVKLMGHYPNVNTYYTQFDVLVIPSVEKEDFPYVVIEAMANSKPIIGTNIAGIPEQVTHLETGLIIEPNDYKNLGESILKLIRNERLRIEMGKRGKEKFEENFSFDTVTNKYYTLFNTNY